MAESLLILCCMKPLLELWKYFPRLKIGYGSTLKMLKIGLEISQKVDESLMEEMPTDSKKIASFFIISCKKLLLDLWSTFLA